jgi:ATP-dependent RNA helicase RhlE
MLRNVEILVLDEADQMLDLGFIHDLKKIVKMLPAKRQSLFFSATMPSAIKDLADKFLTDPVQVSVAPSATTAERVDQYVTFVQQSEKQALLTMMLRAGFSEKGNMDRVLIFTRTKHGADRVVKLLAGNGIAANAIHGNKSQPQRERALAEFKGGKAKILIATDIAARASTSRRQPRDQLRASERLEQYVHRIGRTARAGAAGIAIAYCAEDERAYLKGIERLTKQKIEVVPLPENFLQEAGKISKSRVAVAAPAGQQQRSGEEREDRNRSAAPRAAARTSAQPALPRPTAQDGALREDKPIGSKWYFDPAKSVRGEDVALLHPPPFRRRLPRTCPAKLGDHCHRPRPRGGAGRGCL